MRILAVSDEECPALWDFYTPGRLKEYDLIISCGDLKAEYLSFLVTMARCPVLYVHGNHDGSYKFRPPEGCDCIDDRFVLYNGLRILGLGGCKWYHPGPHQYTERQMRRRIRRLKFQLWRHKGVDIVVTHAAPEGLGDASDNAHRGFASLVELLDKYQPQYLLHGHIHMRYGNNNPQTLTHGATTVCNVGQRYTLDIPTREYPIRQHGQVLFRNREPKKREE